MTQERIFGEFTDLALSERMSDAFYAVDGEWRITYVNDRAESVLAAAMDLDDPGEDLVGRSLWEEIPEAVETRFHDEFVAAMESREPVRFEEYYEPLDTWFEMRLYPSETGLSVYFRDITSERRRERALRERERVLKNLYTVTADADRQFTDKVESLLDIGTDVFDLTYGSLSHIRGEHYEFEIVHAPDGAIEAGDVVSLSATNCERTAATEETVVLQDVAEDAPELTGKDGYTEWGIAAYLGAPVFVDGDVYGTLCFYDDAPRDEPFSEWEVTLVDLMAQWVSYELNHQHTHEQLERQNAQLEQFAHIVSHDLQNPISVLTAGLDLIERETGTDHVDRCYRAVDRMEELIADLLTLAEAGEAITAQEPVALRRVTTESWDTVATQGATLQVETDRTIVADVSRVRQLLENLFSNAVDHGGSDVTVTVGELDDGIYVADDGEGISPPEREAVFDSGYSTSEDGTGFGLNIVHQIATAHGWTPTVTASDTGGARFEFTGVVFEE